MVRGTAASRGFPKSTRNSGGAPSSVQMLNKFGGKQGQSSIPSTSPLTPTSFNQQISKNLKQKRESSVSHESSGYGMLRIKTKDTVIFENNLEGPYEDLSSISNAIHLQSSQQFEPQIASNS